MKRLILGLLCVCVGGVVGAKTVAWYRMDGAVGSTATELVANAATSGTLAAKPIALKGSEPMDTQEGLPSFTTGFPSGWQVYDPVVAARTDNASALHFNGRGLTGAPGGALMVADDPALHLSTFTLEMFVRFDAKEETGKWWQVLAVKPGELPGPKTDSWGLRITDRNKLEARFSAPGGVEPRPPITISATGVALDDGAWHHVALVVNDSSAFFVRLYVDYVLYDHHWINWQAWYGPTPLLVGGNLQTPGPVRGTVDEVRLSNEALEPAQFLRPVGAAGATAPKEFAALLKGFEDSKRPAVIRGVQPDATVMASAVGSYENNEKVIALLDAKGKTREIDCWHYHPYIPNPDDRKNGWWGYDCVDRLKALVTRYNPKARVVQGEVGCPAQLEFGHALCDRPWTEYSQVKWTLRRMLGEAVRGIPYNVFSMVDLQYKDYMLQSFGLLRMNLGKRFVYRRPSFYAVRNVVNLITGRVFALPAESVVRTAMGTRFAGLPVWDSPVLIAERSALKLEAN